jgi:hypothetical protein
MTRRPEDGSVTLWMVVIAAGLLATAGLVAAGGAALAAKSRAYSDAFGAARAGAEALAPSSLALGHPILDPTAARSAATAALASDGAHGSVSVTGRTVSVTVSATTPGGLLALVGVGSLEVSASAAATATAGP